MSAVSVASVLVAGGLDPSVLVDGPGAVRAAASFVLVLSFGAAVRYRYGEAVDRSIDGSVERPLGSVLYGVLAYAVATVLGAYAVTQLLRLGVSAGVGGRAVLAAAVGVVGCVLLGLAGFGFAVVGTYLTELRGRRRPWLGLVVGAAVSAAGWLVLPPLAGLAVWVAVAAFGIGDSARRWVHVPKTRPSGD